MTELSASAPADRARRFRGLERAARQEAEQFQGSMREGYLAIAGGWQSLAEAAQAATVERAADVMLSDDDSLKEAALSKPLIPDDEPSSG